jgi:hypothetical protein
MNGYIQRLATSTRQTTSSIHPMVGSFYSARGRDQALNSGLVAEQLTTEHEDQNVFSQSRTTELKPFELPIVEPTRDTPAIEQESPQLLMPPAADVRPSIKENETIGGAPIDQPQPGSLISPNPPQPKEPPSPVKRTLSSAIEQLMESRPTPVASSQITPAIHRERTAEEINRPALKTKSDVHAATFTPEVRPVRFAPDLGRKRKAEDIQPRTSQREPDEIQIHIGRIEVTAVPAPPVVSPPVKPRHPGPSLEEYLQRRGRK